MEDDVGDDIDYYIPAAGTRNDVSSLVAAADLNASTPDSSICVTGYGPSAEENFLLEPQSELEPGQQLGWQQDPSSSNTYYVDPAQPEAPTYDFLQLPKVVITAPVWTASRSGPVEGSGEGGTDEKFRRIFWRRAKWCPDGSHALTISEDRSIGIFQLPSDVCLGTGKLDVNASPPPRSETPWKPMDPFYRTPSPILDATWYPGATCADEASFCYALSTGEVPVRLVGATDGHLRASYSIIDHRERFVAPHALAFSPDGSQLWCAHSSTITIFSLSRPGSEPLSTLSLSPSRKSRQGQKGLLSSLAFCSDCSGLVAAGTFGGSVGLWREDQGSKCLGMVKDVEGGGITQLAFHPTSPHSLLAASRRSTSLLVYDVRNLRAGPVSRRGREARTNQRVYFDVDWWGRCVADGCTDGKVKVGRWAVGDGEGEEPAEEGGWSGKTAVFGGDEDEAVWTWQAHDDTVSSASFHPYLPLLLTTSGSRHFDLDSSPTHTPPPPSSSSSSSSSASASSDSDDDDFRSSTSRMISAAGGAKDGSMKLWRIGR